MKSVISTFALRLATLAALETGVPLAFGVLTAETDEAALARAGALFAEKKLDEAEAELAKVQADMALLPTMVDEAIRMVSPVMYMRRTATKDTEIRGQKIAEGEKVIMYYGAANRDPAVFADPDRFDAPRANGKDHVAFGIGPHVCLGQRVANMQLEAVYRQILTRFPDMRWTGEIDIAPNNFVHAIRKLGVEFTPERKRAA